MEVLLPLVTSATQPVLSGTRFPPVNRGTPMKKGSQLASPQHLRPSRDLREVLSLGRGQARAQDCCKVQAPGSPELSPPDSRTVPRGQAHSSKAVTTRTREDVGQDAQPTSETEMCPVPQGAWAKDSIPINIHFSIWKGELAENTFAEVLASCVVRTQEQFLSVITDLKRRQIQ